LNSRGRRRRRRSRRSRGRRRRRRKLRIVKKEQMVFRALSNIVPG